MVGQANSLVCNFNLSHNNIYLKDSQLAFLRTANFPAIIVQMLGKYSGIVDITDS